MKKENSLATTAGVLFIAALLGKLAQFVMNIISITSAVGKLGVINDSSIIVSNLTSLMSLIIDNNVIAIAIVFTILFIIACFKTKKKLATAGAVLNMISVIFGFVGTLLCTGYIFIMDQLLTNMAVSYSSSLFWIIVTNVIALLASIFVLSLAKKSSKGTEELKAPMILALIFVGINTILSFSSNVVFLASNVVSLASNVVMAAAIIIMCIWLGTDKNVTPAA